MIGDKMANYAVLDEEDTIINVIVAETKTIAEQVTGKVCVLASDECIIGETWIDPAVAAAAAAAEAAAAAAEAAAAEAAAE